MLLMGSTAAQIAKVNDMDKMREEQKRLSPHIKLKKPVIRQRVETKYTFHKLSVINEFPFPDKAYRLLERLRDDRGIQAIMKDRQWSVGELIELTPFEASILGYNRNAGQLIAVRLRTDDLSGFRHYDSIRKVLLHELTHNVWQEHDDRFHALNRQLNKDVISLDWTAHGGHTLDHNSYYNPQDEEDDDIDHPSYEAGVYRLGGTSDKKSDDIESRRAQLARAAISRLTKKEEKEMDEGCGS
ncbi:WLM domain-containing protein [Pilobolus umbonatus]|nr:WLM domain-containing protein [Pilobolus umbonatus]